MYEETTTGTEPFFFRAFRGVLLGGDKVPALKELLFQTRFVEDCEG